MAGDSWFSGLGGLFEFDGKEGFSFGDVTAGLSKGKDYLFGSKGATTSDFDNPDWDANFSSSTKTGNTGLFGGSGFKDTFSGLGNMDFLGDLAVAGLSYKSQKDSNDLIERQINEEQARYEESEEDEKEAEDNIYSGLSSARNKYGERSR